MTDVARPSLAPMLEPGSVAVVGASIREGSFGEQLMAALQDGGYDGDVYPVNPRYEEVLGRPCYPSLGDLPHPVDLALLAVPNASLEEQLRAALDAGARSAVIYASCFEEPGHGAPALTERLAALARGAGVPVCGGNCMGFLNLERGVRACGYAMPRGLAPGNIAFISHSGSAFAAMAYNDRGLHFNLLVSSGQEFVTTTSDYLDHVLDLPSTRVVGLFLEGVRDPERFRSALSRAGDRDVPVVALKVGREERAARLVTTHSGALAGSDAAFEALFDAHGVARVETLDEMADTLELFATGRRARPGGLASVHDSGGERALLVDVAAEQRVPFASISGQTRAHIQAMLEEGLIADNPLDAWGTGNDYEPIYIESMRALLDDPTVAALAFCVDLTTEMYPEGGYVRVAKEILSHSDKPFAVLSNLSSAIDPRDAAALRADGVAVLEGTSTGLAAFAHLLAYRDFRNRPAPHVPPGPPTEVRARWADRLASGAPAAESESLALLEGYGLEAVRFEVTTSQDAAIEAAAGIGYPVVLKAHGAGLQHKTEKGGVSGRLKDEDEVAQAYRDIAGRLGAEVIVAEHVEVGVEVALGVVRDEQYGPLIMAAAGGALVEVVRDRRFALPPVDHRAARKMLERLGIRPLLHGVRSGPAADLDALAGAIVSLSVLACDLGEHIEALDVNPVMAGPDRCVAVDALVVPRA